MKSGTRIVLALTISFLLGVVISFLNRGDLFLSFQSGFIFAMIVTTVVAMMSWGMDIAVDKGYPGWAGFVLVLIFNVLGFVILAVLPNKTGVTSSSSQ